MRGPVAECGYEPCSSGCSTADSGHKAVRPQAGERRERQRAQAALTRIQHSVKKRCTEIFDSVLPYLSTTKVATRSTTPCPRQRDNSQQCFVFLADAAQKVASQTAVCPRWVGCSPANEVWCCLRLNGVQLSIDVLHKQATGMSSHSQQM